MNTVYQHNSCGVVTNPTVIFQYDNPKFLAWDYYQITLGQCPNGLWDYGISHAGGGFAVSGGRYNSAQDAEIEAIKRLKEKFENGLPSGSMGNPNCFAKAKASFNEFLTNKLVYNAHLAKHLNYTKSIQLALF